MDKSGVLIYAKYLYQFFIRKREVFLFEKKTWPIVLFFRIVMIN